MANNILKEAIADAKAVREVALANAKAALEEAFTPKLQSMLSAKLSETLNEEEEDLEEMYMDEKMDEPMDEMDMGEEMDEIAGMDEEDMGEGADLDEEIDLEEILNELELEEGAEAEEETVEEAKAEDDEKDLEEIHSTDPKADDVQQVIHKAEDIYEEKDFDLDALLEEINNLDENEDEVNEGDFGEAKEEMDENILSKAFKGIQDFATFFNSGSLPADKTLSNALFQLVPGGKNAVKSFAEFGQKAQALGADKAIYADDSRWRQFFETGAAPRREGVNEAETNEIMTGAIVAGGLAALFTAAKKYSDFESAVEDPDFAKKHPKAANLVKALQGQGKMAGDARRMEEEAKDKELEETKLALDTVKSELNEVNLLNSKLLYVNRIFKANTLDEGQKLRVVETLDKAETAKEAKLIYETIKDTFNVAKSKKASFKTKTKSLKEGIGMASKAAGTSTAPKKEILSESNDMMTRFQKLANIKINQ